MEKSLDMIIRGEIEETLKETFNYVLKGKSYNKLKGISYRLKDKILNNPDRDYMKNLDWLPMPAWNLVNLKYYTLPFSDQPFLLLGTARGCPHNCSFCTAKPYYGRGLRYRDVKKIADEIEYVKKRYKVNEFLMWTEAFTANKKYCLDICDEIIKRKLNIKFVCNSRVDSIDEEILSKLKQAGCWMIGFGIESGNQKILDDARKGITLKQSVRACKLTRKHGIEITAHCMVGLPGESKETVRQTFKFIKLLDPEFAQFYCVVPMPWTDLYKEVKPKGWIKSEDFHLYEQNVSILHTGKMSPEEVMRAREWIYKRFYIRPITILRTIKRIKNFNNFKKFMMMVRDFLTWV